MLIAAASLFFLYPRPLEMPKAEAWYVSGAGGRYLEDRYDMLDLWTSRTVIGRWIDDDSRVFTLSRLETLAPKFGGSTSTRKDYAANEVFLSPKDKDEDPRRDAIEMLSPVPPAEKPAAPRRDIRGMDAVRYLHGTNTESLVCAFLPEKHPCWYLATWELIPGDDIELAAKDFESEVLSKWADLPLESEKEIREAVKEHKDYIRRRSRKRLSAGGERDLLKEDLQRSVANYPQWRCTQAENFTILDDLPRTSAFIHSLTNQMAEMTAKYASAVPSPLSASNTLAVARIYKDREEYLSALDVGDVSGMEWSAAYWDKSRRELVAYLPAGGDAELLKTFRHEAFHQYLSYASSMVTPSPWLNEGYAQYFEDEESDDWRVEVDIESAASAIPAVLDMDYSEFYAGTDAERRFKYALAWSIAYFLEKGADKIRFRPFKDLKSDYMKHLLSTQDMRKATALAFAQEEKLKLFVSEWKKFWLKRKG